MTPVPADGDLYLASEVQSNVANAREPCSQTVRLPAIGPAHPTFGASLIVLFMFVCGGVLPPAVSRLGFAEAHGRRRPFC